ncbi:hypothetical protein ACIBQ5_36225 [Streptomyces massasporeus]|uniref:hypothetical protein n=1 Tax=Streptomyces massasporeus TaxID=67324 RepID=UPI0037B9846E
MDRLRRRVESGAAAAFAQDARAGSARTPDTPDVHSDPADGTGAAGASPATGPLELPGRGADIRPRHAPGDGTAAMPPAVPPSRAPWYALHGMLGEGVVQDAERWSRERADETAGAMTARMADRALAGTVRREMAGLLAVNDPGRWGDLLRSGVFSVRPGTSSGASAEQLVWIKPELVGLTLVDGPADGERDLNSYTVRFSSTSATVERSRNTTNVLGLAVLGALSTGSAAVSTVVHGVPAVVAEAGTFASRGRRHTFIAGQGFVVEESRTFSAAVRFRLFTDGREHLLDGAVPRGLRVRFPAAHSGPAEPRPDLAAPAVEAQPGPAGRPRSHEECVHALDMTPVLVEVQAGLRAHGMAASHVRDIMTQLRVIGEEVRRRGPSVLANGYSTGVLGSRSGMLGRGHGVQLRLSADVESLQFLGVTPAVKIRQDLGAGLASITGGGGVSAASITAGANLAGLVDPALLRPGAHAGTTGLAPLVTITAGTSRGSRHRRMEQSQRHTVLTREDEEGRYRARLRVRIEWTAPSHPRLTARASTVPVDADVSVPWLGGKGAADFEEQVLGAVHSPFVAASLDATSRGTGPVEAQPHVRALMRVAGVHPSRPTARPHWGLGDYRRRHHPREPLVMASGRGLEPTCVVSAMPGAHSVLESLRGVVADIARERGLNGSAMAAIDRQLEACFGVAALVGEPTDVLTGVTETLRMGSAPVTFSVRAHLLDSRRVTTCSLVVDTRVSANDTTTVTTDHRWSLQAAAGGGARLDLPGGVRLQLGGARLLGRMTGGSGDRFTSATAHYARTEADGPADVHEVGLGFELSVRTKGRATERWWLDGPHLAAHIVVPHRIAPAAPVTDDEIRAVGTLRDAGHPLPPPGRGLDHASGVPDLHGTLRSARHYLPPVQDTLSFSSGVSGIYPSFSHMPALRATITAMHALLHGRGEGAEELTRQAHPRRLTASFADLVDQEGLIVGCTTDRGVVTTMRLRMTCYGPRRLEDRNEVTGGPVEIEQYYKTAERHARIRETGYGLTAQATLGPQIRFGSDSSADHGVGGHGEAVGHHGGGPGGRLTAMGYVAAGAQRHLEHEVDTGSIAITRATYTGAPAVLRAHVACEIDMCVSRNGKTVKSVSRFVCFTDGVTLLVPRDRIHDVLPASPADERDPHEADAGTPPTLNYLNDGLLPRTSVHTEVLRADGVLDEICKRLEARGVLRPRSDIHAVSADPVRRAMKAAFGTTALARSMPHLLAHGVSVCCPVPGFGGTTTFVWARVMVESVEPRHHHSHRPETTSTLRTESVREDKSVDKRGRAAGGGAMVLARGGGHDADDGRHAHAGVDYAAGRMNGWGAQWTRAQKVTDIYRSAPRDGRGCEAFEHRLLFRVVTGTTRLGPQALRVFAQGAGLVAGTAARLIGPRYRETAPSARPWNWYDDGSTTLVEGSARFLVPAHLTVPVAPGPQPDPFPRLYGDRPRWQSPGAADTLSEAFLDAVHPWDVAAADAVRAWARTAAHGPSRTGAASEGEPVRAVEGLRALSGAEQVYELYTSAVMLAPRIKDLLGQRGYRIPVGNRTVVARFLLTGATALGPADGVRFKARRYQQVDDDREHSHHEVRGHHHGGGPEAGGGLDDYALLTRTLFETGAADEEKLTSAVADTDEHNKEGTRAFRYLRFDLTVELSDAADPGRVLAVDVPGGLLAMLPLRDGQLPDDLAGPLARLWSRTVADRAPLGGATAVADPPGAPQDGALAGSRPALRAGPPARRSGAFTAGTPVRRGHVASLAAVPEVAEADERVAAAGETSTAAVPVPEAVRIERLLDDSETVWEDHRPVAVLLPGSQTVAAGMGIDLPALRRLPHLLPHDAVLVVGESRAGEFVVAGSAVPIAALAGLLSAAAPGRIPLLAAEGADRHAAALAEKLGSPVIATGHGLRLDAASGAVVPASPKQNGARGCVLRLFDVEHPGGVPLGIDLRAAPWTPGPADVPATAAQRSSAPGPVRGNPVGVHRAVLSAGIPAGPLPGLPEVLRQLRALAGRLGVEVPERDWALLPQELQGRYSDLVSGVVVTLGGAAEALVHLDPVDPREEGQPAVTSRATEVLNTSVAPLPLTQTRSGLTSATRFGAGASVGVGLAPGVLEVCRIGVGVSGTANASLRSTSRVFDTEEARAESARQQARLVTFRPNWSVRVRTESDCRWESVAPTAVEVDDACRLRLHIPEDCLKVPTSRTAVTGGGARNRHLPPTHYASSPTGLPALCDHITRTLRGQGLALPIGSAARTELLQRVWDLRCHLEEALDPLRGYAFSLHDERGRAVASVTLRSVCGQRAERVTTSETVLLERVRTAVQGVGGAHTVSSSLTLTAPSLDFGLRPFPTHPALSLGVSAFLARTSADYDGMSTGRTGLKIMVTREGGPTTAYEMDLMTKAAVAVRGHRTVTTPEVSGRLRVRMTVADAHRHGFPVDVAAREAPTVTRADPRQPTVPASAGPPATHGTAGGTGEPQSPGPVNTASAAPTHVTVGRGIGMGVVDVRASTAKSLLDWTIGQLQPAGFLPPDVSAPLADGGRRSHADRLDRQCGNLEWLRHFFSRPTLEANFDALRQTGLTGQLRVPRGALGAGLWADEVTITVTAEDSGETPIEEEGYAGHPVHVVTLSMGLDNAGQSSGGSLKLAAGFRFRTVFDALRAGATGGEVFVQRAVGQHALNMTNKPALSEWAGRARRIDLTSTYTVTLTFRSRMLPGGSGSDSSARFSLAGQIATAHLPALTRAAQPEAPPAGPRKTLRRVLDRAVVDRVDTHGLPEAAASLLPRLTGSHGWADQEIRAFLGHTLLSTHLGEILDGAYTTDQFFDSGLVRDTRAAIHVGGVLGASAFLGAAREDFVLGSIRFGLEQAGTAATASAGARWLQADIAVGTPVGSPGTPLVQGQTDGSRTWQTNTSVTRNNAVANERIQVVTGDAYLYRAGLTYELSVRLEKEAKCLPLSAHGAHRTVTGHSVSYWLAERDALDWYAAGVLPVPDAQLVDAMNRWYAGELHLSGDTAAGVLIRWSAETPEPDLRRGTAGPAGSGPLAGLVVDRRELPSAVARRHREGTLPIRDGRTRTAFRHRFGIDLSRPADELPGTGLPEYLTREDQSGRILGHSAVRALAYDDGRTTYDIVCEQVERVAPGLLAARPELWTDDGRRIGRTQGARDFLQALLASGRDATLWESICSPGGKTLHLVDPHGLLLRGVVEITVSAALDSKPAVRDLLPGTGLENYRYDITAAAVGGSRDVTQTFTVGELTAGPTGTHGSAGIGVNTANHRGATHVRTETHVQTAYASGETYVASVPFTLTVSTRRLTVEPRMLLWARTLLPLQPGSRHAPTVTESATGRLDLQVPRGVAEFRPLQGPRTAPDARPWPPPPPDGYVAGAAVSAVQPAVLDLLTTVFGRGTSADRVRAHPAIRQLLTPGQLTGHLMKATGGHRHLVADELSVSGSSSRRVALYLIATCSDLEVIGPIAGTGTGRYTKHQDSTVRNVATDRWRPSASVVASGSGAVQPDSSTPATYRPHGMSGEATGVRSTGAGLADAPGHGARQEQHVKRRGPTVLVRYRLTGRAEADTYDRSLWNGTTTPLTTRRGAPFTSDVYLELDEEWVDALLAERAGVCAPRDAAVRERPREAFTGPPRGTDHGRRDGFPETGTASCASSEVPTGQRGQSTFWRATSDAPGAVLRRTPGEAGTGDAAAARLPEGYGGYAALRGPATVATAGPSGRVEPGRGSGQPALQAYAAGRVKGRRRGA